MVTQVNHLGHFLLTLELLPVLQTTAGETGDVRVVCVSSSAHSWCKWEPDNMNAERDYSRLKFYPKSKLYNVSEIQNSLLIRSLRFVSLALNRHVHKNYPCK